MTGNGHVRFGGGPSQKYCPSPGQQLGDGLPSGSQDNLFACGWWARRVPSLKDLWVTGTCPGPHDYVSREGKSPLRLVWAVQRP